MRNFKFDFEQFGLTSNEKRNQRIIKQPKTILEALENIVIKSEGSNLQEEFFSEAKKEIKIVTDKLGLTPNQAILLAIFVENSNDSRIRTTEIADHLGCNNIKVLRLSNDIEDLLTKRYIRSSCNDNNVFYRVPKEVTDALQKDKPFIYIKKEVTNIGEFLDRFDELMNERNNDEITYKTLVQETEEMLNKIKDSDFVKELRKYKMDQDENIIFIFMTHLLVRDNDNNVQLRDLSHLYGQSIPFNINHGLRSKKLQLFKNQLIEQQSHDGLLCPESYRLTQKAKRELLGNLNIFTTSSADKNLLDPNTLAQKSLIYNPKEKTRIEELNYLLTDEQFNNVQFNLEKSGMRKGFCCLFYGDPGTGKTETVYQIAKNTGRKIMKVDVNKIKASLVGESEKNIKELFDRYRNICKNSKLKPILLFNEADAVLGIRLKGANHAVEKMENSIQNIILQEMENLEGIMIATTNLTTNLDSAFERRFIYKIQFNRPTEEARAKIWLTMIPDLSNEEASALAHKYDFSGGEIENIVRKQTINSILKGSEIANIESIDQFCQEEKIVNSRPRIGF